MTAPAATPSRICRLWTDSQEVTSCQTWPAWKPRELLSFILCSLALPGPFPAEKGNQPALGARQIFRGARTMQGKPSLRRFFHRLDDGRMDVGFAADRRRVAERLGHRLEQGLQADALLAGAADLLEGDHARRPGAEVLGGEIFAG